MTSTRTFTSQDLYTKRTMYNVDHPERQSADFQVLQRKLLSFSTPSAACENMEASQLTDKNPAHLTKPIVVNPSPASRQQLGLKIPAMSRLKAPQLMEHLRFSTEVCTCF